MAQLTVLDHAYRWEEEEPDQLWLTQPTGGELRTFRWAVAVR